MLDKICDKFKNSNGKRKSKEDFGLMMLEMILILAIGISMMFLIIAMRRSITNVVENIDETFITAVEEVPDEPVEPSKDERVSKYYIDEIGIITPEGIDRLETGMRTFYKETDIQPYLYIVDNIDNFSSPDSEAIEKWLDIKYNDMFMDETHMLVLAIKNDEVDNHWIKSGSEIENLANPSTEETLINYIDEYFENGYKAETVYSKAFIDTATKIIANKENEQTLDLSGFDTSEVTDMNNMFIDSGNVENKDNNILSRKINWKDFINVLIIIGLIISPIIIIYKWKEKRKIKKAKEFKVYEDAVNVINTPIEEIMNNIKKENSSESTFKHKDVDLKRLKDKYKSHDNPWARY